MVIELDPVDRITADAVGEPGERSFYLQARKGPMLITLLVEKQQVQLLANRGEIVPVTLRLELAPRVRQLGPGDLGEREKRRIGHALVIAPEIHEVQRRRGARRRRSTRHGQ